MQLSKSKINIQLDKFDNEGIQPLSNIIEDYRTQGKDASQLEYRLKIYQDLYDQTQRLVYSHAVFVHVINKIHKRCKQIGFVDDEGTVSFDCMEDDMQQVYKLILHLIEFYKQHEQDFNNNDEIVSLIKDIQEQIGSIKFVD